MFDDSVSRYGKSQFELDTLGETDIDEAVKDSREQLLTVVSVDRVMEEIGVVVELETTELLLETLLFPLEMVMLRLVIVVEFWVVGAGVVVDVDELVKMSLLLNGSKADWDERLNTEPQSILLVLLLSTSSTSPKAESTSLVLLGGEASDEMPGDGNGVARPLDGSFKGWCS